MSTLDTEPDPIGLTFQSKLGLHSVEKANPATKGTHMTQVVLERRPEPSDLERKVEDARARLPLQADTALVEALSDKEILAERELAEWIRAQRRTHRRRMVEVEISTEWERQKEEIRTRRAAAVDRRWHSRAVTARRRAADADARFAQLHRRSEWSSRALIAVVIVGMLWAGVNVQHNLVPNGDMSDPLYWLSYGIEAMISIPIIVIMVTATTAARWGRELERGKVVLLELVLLLITLGLNAGPHLAEGHGERAAETAIAPAMVGVVIWLHSWVAARYAALIEAAAPPDVEDADACESTPPPVDLQIATSDSTSNVVEAGVADVPPAVDGGGVAETGVTNEGGRGAAGGPVPLCMPYVFTAPERRPVPLCMPYVPAVPAQPRSASVQEAEQIENSSPAAVANLVEPERDRATQPAAQADSPEQVGNDAVEEGSNQPSENPSASPVAAPTEPSAGPESKEPDVQNSIDLQQEAERIYLQQARAMQARGWFPRIATESIASVLDALKRGDHPTAIQAETGVAPQTVRRIRERRDELKGGLRGPRATVPI